MDKADVDRRDKYKDTALTRAVKVNRCPIVELLIRWGADVNLFGTDYYSPLLGAVH